MPTDDKSNASRFRYPGPASFGDDPVSRSVFYGRDDDISCLADRIASEDITILYGKSGIGKTSLLNAGLLPRLRALSFAPIVVRADVRHSRFADRVNDAFLAAVEEHQIAVSGSLPAASSSNHGDRLRSFFSDLLLSKDDEFLTPVLIVDQFEELLRSDSSDVEGYTNLLSRLFEKSRDDFGKPLNLRLVLSLREEFVGALEDMAPAVPGLLSNLYRLRPLRSEGARLAMVKPAQLESPDFVSPKFEFDPAMVDGVMNFLESRGQFEPIQLQIVCRHIEHEVIERVELGRSYSPVTTASYFEDTELAYQSILERFYLETVDTVDTDIDQIRVRDLCEYGLVRPDGYRDSISAERIQRDYGLSTDVLDSLVDARLIRREDRLNDLWYELTHDRLAEAIAAKRRFRLPQGFVVFLVAGVIAVSGVIAALFIETRRSAELREQQTAVEEAYDELAARSSQIETQNREIEALRSRLTNASRSMATELIQRGGLKLPRMVEIPAGSFVMGEESEDGSSFSRPARSVTIGKAFHVSQFEITFSQYDQFASAVGRPLPDDEGWGRDNRPVINVTWEDALAYAAWLTDTVRAESPSAPAYRLPTEAEWEYVARAGTTGRYGFVESGEADLCAYANHADVSLGSLAVNRSCSDVMPSMTAPVGTYNANAFGVNDTHGNVAEWVADCWNESYERAPSNGSAWLSGLCSRRVVRGGSWFDSPEALRVYSRSWNHIGFGDETIGFRVVQDVD